MEESILKRMPGFPCPHTFKNSYKKIEIETVNESFLGKEVIVIMKYPKLLYGNMHSDFLFIGILEGSNPIDKLCIADTRVSKNIVISKKRFHGILELYIRA